MSHRQPEPRQEEARKGWPTILTSRLSLRPFAKEDVNTLHQLLDDEEVVRYFPNTTPPPRERVEKMVSQILTHWDDRGYGLWAVVSRVEQELLGWSGLQFLPETNEIEIAYLLGKLFWRKGLATEAALASLQYGFAHLELHRIVAVVHPENAASQRVIAKLGMVFTNQARYFGMNVYRYILERSDYSPRPERIQAILWP